MDVVFIYLFSFYWNKRLLSELRDLGLSLSYNYQRKRIMGRIRSCGFLLFSNTWMMAHFRLVNYWSVPRRVRAPNRTKYEETHNCVFYPWSRKDLIKVSHRKSSKWLKICSNILECIIMMFNLPFNLYVYSRFLESQSLRSNFI